MRNLLYPIRIELKAGESETNYRKFRRTNLDDGRPTLRLLQLIKESMCNYAPIACSALIHGAPAALHYSQN